MAKTDGYLSTGDDWLYSNAGGEQGAISDPETSGVKIRLTDGSAIAGTTVSGNGAFSEGAAIDFSDPTTLLSSAAATTSSRPSIVWAGVNPMSLSEVLIVWNTEIVLLNKSKISAGGGGSVIAVTGRLMIVKLGSPIAINGLEQKDITIESGAVGFYSGGGEEEYEAKPCSDDVGPITTLGVGGGPLTDPPEPTDCGCSDPEQGAGGGGGGGAPAGAQVAALVFSTICNPSAQCGEVEGDKSQFIVNNSMNFPVRCTYPFYVATAKTGHFGDCNCDGSCERDAEVWEVCMNLWGSTMPGEVFPLDQLATFDPCSVGDKFSSGYGAQLTNDVECGGKIPAQDASVDIMGRFGKVVTKTGKWLGPNPGYEGQSAIYKPECLTVCDTPCQAVVEPDHVDCVVPEDIIKPLERTLPIKFFDNFSLKTTEVEFPSTIEETDVKLVTFIGTTAFEIDTDISTELIANLIWEYDQVESIEWITFIGTDTAEIPTAIGTDEIGIPDEDITHVTDVILTNISYISDHDTKIIEFVTPEDGAFMVSDVVTQTVTFGVVDDPVTIVAVTAALLDATPVYENRLFVTNVDTKAINFATTQDSFLVEDFDSTGIILVTDVKEAPAKNFVTSPSAGKLIDGFDEIAIVFCTGGVVTTATVIANLSTIDVGIDTLELVTYIGTSGPVDVAYNIQTATVNMDSEEFAINAAEGTVEILTAIATTPAVPVSTPLDTVSALETSVFTFDTVAPPTSAVTVVTNIDIDTIEVVHEIKTAVVSTTSVVFATELFTSEVDYITEIATSEVSVDYLTVVVNPKLDTFDFVTAVKTTEQTLSLAKDTIGVDVLVEGDDFTVITVHTEQNCGVAYQLLHHDGQKNWTSITTRDASCTPPEQAHNCKAIPLQLQKENLCQHIMLLRANYVGAPASASATACFGYDCQDESCEEPGGGPFEPEPGGMENPCTVRVRRLNRRWASNTVCDRSGYNG